MGASGPANGSTDIGLSLMAVMAVAGSHSALAPSIFTFRVFASKTEEERAAARETLYLSLVASTVTSLGILLVFKRWTPAIVGEVAGLLLFGLGMRAVHSAPFVTSTMAEKRAEQISQQQGATAPQPQTVQVA